VIAELLPDGHHWLRIADRHWRDPLDPAFAQARGGRWNPPGTWPTLYLNEDTVTARLNLRAFVAGWPYEP
jgi:RES domain-containing protein